MLFLSVERGKPKQLQTQPTYDAESGIESRPHWYMVGSKLSALTTVPARLSIIRKLNHKTKKLDLEFETLSPLYYTRYI